MMAAKELEIAEDRTFREWVRWIRKTVRMYSLPFVPPLLTVSSRSRSDEEDGYFIVSCASVFLAFLLATVLVLALDLWLLW